MNEKQEALTPTTFGLMKYVHVMYFVGALLIGYLLVMLIDWVWMSLRMGVTWVPEPSHWATIGIGAGTAAGLTFYLWRHPKVNRLAIEIVGELSKVTWPTRKELSVSTVVVIVVSIIAAIILGLFDLFWSWATTELLSL